MRSVSDPLPPGVQRGPHHHAAHPFHPTAQTFHSRELPATIPPGPDPESEAPVNDHTSPDVTLMDIMPKALVQW